jgi:hypothetical protein
VPATSRERLLHRAIRLSQVSIAWSGLSGCAAIAVGLVVGAISLAGYGLDAAVDALASVVLVHRFHTERHAPHDGERLERRATYVVAVALILSSVFLTGSAIRALATHHAPDATAFGLTLASISMVVLPPLAIAKRRTATRLASAALRGDSTLTAFAALLALGALLGLVLDPAFGWWWADSVIALAVAAVLLREARTIVTDQGPAGAQMGGAEPRSAAREPGDLVDHDGEHGHEHEDVAQPDRRLKQRVKRLVFVGSLFRHLPVHNDSQIRSHRNRTVVAFPGRERPGNAGH